MMDNKGTLIIMAAVFMMILAVMIFQINNRNSHSKSAPKSIGEHANISE